MKSTYYFSLGGVLLALAMFGVGVPDARANTIAFTAPGGLVTNVNPNVPVNLGLTFTANSTFSVNALGIYYQSSLTGPEQVGLYDSTGTLLATTTVALTDSLVNGYLFHNIAPVVLTAGNTYTVDAFVGNNSWAYGAAPITTSFVTYQNSTYLYGGSLAFPTNAGAVTYYGPNFQIAAPEPGGFGTLATLAAVLAGCFRKRLGASGRSVNTTDV